MKQLIAIGNSQGIRIPKPLIKQAKLENTELEFIVIDKGFLFDLLKVSTERDGLKILNKLFTSITAKMMKLC